MRPPIRRLRLAATGSILAVAVLALTQVPALALGTTPDTTWMTNGIVHASVQVGNTLYIGGIFTQVQDAVSPTQVVSTTGLAAIDMAAGTAIPTFTHTVAYSLGQFQVLSLAVSPDQSTLFVGGTFDSIDAQPRAHLAAIDLATGQLTSWAPVVYGGNPEVAAMLTTSDGVYIGGDFSKVNGKGRKKLAKVSYAGVLDSSWKPKANDRVGALALAADGLSIFVGGNFETITITSSGVSTIYNRQSIARLTLDTGVPTNWQLAYDSQMVHNRVHAIVASRRASTWELAPRDRIGSAHTT